MSSLEILAPAGSPEALTAAVRCGADAVYLGAPGFNARQHAKNFTYEELEGYLAYCHVRGVRVHLTLNTLVREEEGEAALRVAKTACDMGVDALIVQDPGLARRIRYAAPDMPLHASTQTACHTPAGVEALRDMGFSRVVLAREMRAEEIAACAGLGCELEMFVHGALCMCLSGQCYLSAALGGRSGNRGLCAQPCRLPFSPTGRKPKPDDYAMSLKDLCLARRFSELAGLGVCSLKIEGRMKRPEYVAAATSLYAGLRDGKTPSDEELERLQAVFSRSGFTDGYFTGRRGAPMFGHRRQEDVTAAEGVLKELRRLYDKEPQRVPVTGSLAAGTLTVTDGDRTVTLPVPADRQEPLSRERAEMQLQKTGGTPYRMTDVRVEGDSFCSVAALNGARREALEKLTELRGTPRTVAYSHDLPPVLERIASPLWRQERPRLIARLSSPAQLTRRVRELADGWILPLGAKTDAPWGVEIPRGMFGRANAIRRELAAAKEAGAVWALCGNIGAIPLAKEAGLLPLGGLSLNVMNGESLAAYGEMGLAAATLSMELAFSQMGFAAASPLPTGLLIYGRQPLMLTRNCPRQSAGGDCTACGPTDGVLDRKGVVFPTACSGGCTELLNSVPLWWGDRLGEIPTADFLLLHFTVETPAEVERALTAYRQGGAAPGPITRGLYRNGVE